MSLFNRASLDLAHIFITFLHIRKDIAHEIASIIISARQHLIQPISIEKSSSSSIVLSNENDDLSISSGIVTGEESDTVISEHSSVSNSINDNNEQDQNKIHSYLNKNIYSSNSQQIMNRMTSYLSEVDWRVFNYITKYFLQNGKKYLQKKIYIYIQLDFFYR